jgi:tetratricopeptide (TPR) repeat protein
VGTEELYGLLLPSRFEIYKLLQSGEKLYASKIAERLKMDRKLVSFHLAWLEQHGFLTSNFGLANPERVAPKAVRYYETTDKGGDVLNAIRELINLPEIGRSLMREGYSKLVGNEASEESLVLFRNAEGYFRNAHDLDPKNPHYPLNIADSLFAQGRIDEAKVWALDAMKGLKPDSDHLAEFMRRWGRYLPGGTSAILETIGMANCRDAEALNSNGRQFMRQGYSSQKEEQKLEYFRKGEACFRKAHELNNSNGHYQLNIADSLFAQGQYEEANEHFVAGVQEVGRNSDHVMGIVERWSKHIHSLR